MRLELLFNVFFIFSPSINSVYSSHEKDERMGVGAGGPALPTGLFGGHWVGRKHFSIEDGLTRVLCNL